jgi:hypothetical protein
MWPSILVKLRLTFVLSAATLATFGTAAAADEARPLERSRGDPAVFAILARQGIEPAIVLASGTTLTKLCDIRHADGRASYHLYWLEHLTQAAIQVHGRAEIIVISHAGDVLGTYDSDMRERPRCAGHNSLVRTVDVADGKAEQHATTFSPSRLPHWLGGGSGFFSAATPYVTVTNVDGIALPPPMRW